AGLAGFRRLKMPVLSAAGGKSSLRVPPDGGAFDSIRGGLRPLELPRWAVKNSGAKFVERMPAAPAGEAERSLRKGTAGGGAKGEPSAAGRLWRGRATERSGCPPPRRAKRNGVCKKGAAGGGPKGSPAQRVPFGEDEQRSRADARRP